MPASIVTGRLRIAAVGLLTLLALLVGGAVAAPAAVAGPCQTCEDPPPPPPPGPPGPPPVKHRLTIKKIVCYDTNDGGTQLNDELYVKVNGSTVYGPVSINPLNGVRHPNVSRVLTGASGVYLGDIQLWDDDDTSADDKIGTLNVYGNGSPTEITGTYNFTGSDAHYTVEIGLQQI
jgi:hypothetical protein